MLPNPPKTLQMDSAKKTRGLEIAFLWWVSNSSIIDLNYKLFSSYALKYFWENVHLNSQSEVMASFVQQLLVADMVGGAGVWTAGQQQETVYPQTSACYYLILLNKKLWKALHAKLRVYAWNAFFSPVI